MEQHINGNLNRRSNRSENRVMEISTLCCWCKMEISILRNAIFCIFAALSEKRLDMGSKIDTTLMTLLNETLSNLEKNLNSDVLCYYGNIVDGNENALLDIVEDLVETPEKRDTLTIILTTNGGSTTAVERYVNIIRKHYQKVVFIVPDHAYSAGTIFCMSGDEIWMDYFSVLGPIDPQVPNKEKRWVPALGYLDKVNELLEKAKTGELTQAEFLILKDFDLAELRAYEQAKELTITLLKMWLVKYKFKNWDVHSSTGEEVTPEDKEKRAEEIANALSDNKEWKSHGRPINIEELEGLKLKIEDYSDRKDIRNPIREYYNMIRDYIAKYNLNIFIHTRKFI